MLAQPLITVNNVELSSDWYQKILGFESGHGGPDYERLFFDGAMVLQLHRWEAHDHPHLGDAESGSVGNGVALWFKTDQIDKFLSQLVRAGIVPIEGPQYNFNAQHREVWIKDPDGYVVVIAGNREPAPTDEN